MSSLKIHVIKGVNSYTDNLIKTEQRNINRRREVNFNVGNLNENQRSSSRAKSFAIYKPASKPKPEPKVEKAIKSVNFEDDKENQNKFEFKNEKIDNEATGEPKVNRETNDANESKNESDDGFDIDEPNKQQSEDETETYTFGEAKDKKAEEEDEDEGEDGFADYLFSSNRDRKDSASITFSDDKPGGKFKKFTDKLKDTFDQNNLKQKHERNMENMRRQFKGMLGTKADPDSDAEGFQGSEVDYWGDPAETTFRQAGGPRPFGPGRLNAKKPDYDSDDGSKKRCCC